jgi:hypothetical protein
MARFGLRLAVCAALGLCACAARAERPLYEMRDGRVFFPGWDDRAVTTPVELLSLPAAEFEKPAHVYRDRVIFGGGSVTSKLFRMPDTATTVSVVARGVPEAGIFPRLRVSLVVDGANATTVFEGYLQSLGMARLTGPVPPAVRGRQARVVIEFLNPSDLNDQRVVWMMRVAVE